MADAGNGMVIEGSALLGQILVKNGYLTQQQLDACLAIHSRPDNTLRLGDIAVEQGYVTRDVVERAVKSRDRFVKAQRRAQAVAAREEAMAARQLLAAARPEGDIPEPTPLPHIPERVPLAPHVQAEQARMASPGPPAMAAPGVAPPVGVGAPAEPAMAPPGVVPAAAVVLDDAPLPGDVGETAPVDRPPIEEPQPDWLETTAGVPMAQEAQAAPTASPPRPAAAPQPVPASPPAPAPPPATAAQPVTAPPPASAAQPAPAPQPAPAAQPAPAPQPAPAARPAGTASGAGADSVEFSASSVMPMPGADRPPEQKDAAAARQMLQWLGSALKSRVSDLHVKSGMPLVARLNGQLVEMKSPAIDERNAERLLCSLLTDEQWEELQTRHSVNLCLDLPGGGRARCSIFRHFRGTDGAFRLIPAQIPDLTSLNLPTMLAKFTTYAQGLVLVTGPAGSGKSTTLAALVDIVNRDRSCHILTVEDPIEFVHTCQRSLVTERQVGTHTLEFSNALRAALREDPDVIVVGEMHDTETAQLTISAAETGHLVFATLHTQNAVRSINRVIDMFPPEEQPQIRTMLSESLRGVVSQRLVPRADASGRLPVVEVMFNSTAIANLIREKKTFQISNLIKMASASGSTTLEDYAAALAAKGYISQDVVASCKLS